MRAGTQEVITRIMALTIFQISSTFQTLNFLSFGSNQRESLNDLGSYYSTNCPLALLCRVKSVDIHQWSALREMGRKIMLTGRDVTGGWPSSRLQKLLAPISSQWAKGQGALTLASLSSSPPSNCLQKLELQCVDFPSKLELRFKMC